MARVTNEVIRALWYRALDEEIGIAVATEDKRLLQNLLYEERKSSGDEALQAIVIVCPARFLDQLWLVKKSVEMEL